MSDPVRRNRHIEARMWPVCGPFEARMCVLADLEIMRKAYAKVLDDGGQAMTYDPVLDLLCLLDVINNGLVATQSMDV